MTGLKVMTILGTRPEIIRLSSVIRRLDQFTDHRLVHTGQSYDFELSQVFFDELEVRKPDYFLNAGGGSLGERLAKVFKGTEQVLLQDRPDAVLILGDTNSALAAIIVRRMGIPIYHMEAGNRSFDRNVPEETNRKIVDHIADFNLVYTEHARRHLLSEGLPHRRINLTGSPMREVLERFRDKIEASTILAELGAKKDNYFVASLHRQENVDHPDRLKALLSALNKICETWQKPVFVSAHPRLTGNMEPSNHQHHDLLHFAKPYGFFDYNHLQINACCVISDSGTIAEESAILGFPAVSPRDSIERPEALDVGNLIITGTDPQNILDGVTVAMESFQQNHKNGRPQPVPADYSILNTSERVVNLIIGTARLSNDWDNIRVIQ